ncbi:MAG: hypothetical protein JRJ64_16345 [Deltaproteobacteria bacterium]|nr:hypothetical protein [Deltaproteobacteria bacterium]
MPILAQWAADETIDVAFVIAPRFAGGADAFADWATSIVQAHSDVFLTQAPSSFSAKPQTPRSSSSEESG